MSGGARHPAAKTLPPHQLGMREFLAQALFCAVRDGMDGEVERLLALGADPNSRHAGHTPLTIAASWGRLGAAAMLARLADARGSSPMHLAAGGGRMDMAQLLAPISDPSQTDGEGASCAQIARKMRHPELADWLDAWALSREESHGLAQAACAAPAKAKPSRPRI